MTLSDKIDRDLARQALEKQRQGQRPSVREMAALRRVERDRQEQEFSDLSTKIPQKWWREWSGRQTVTLKAQAARYGLPFGGKAIDLPKLVRALHDFLAANAHKLASGDERNATPTARELRQAEDAKIRRLERLKMEGRLVPIEELWPAIDAFAGHIRRAGESLLRNHGPEAHEILKHALEDASRELDHYRSPDDKRPS